MPTIFISGGVLLNEFLILNNENAIRTRIDDLLRYCEDLKETDINFLVSLIKLPKSLIEKWLIMLEEKGIVELEYTFTNIKVKINGHR